LFLGAIWLICGFFGPGILLRKEYGLSFILI